MWYRVFTELLDGLLTRFSEVQFLVLPSIDYVSFGAEKS